MKFSIFILLLGYTLNLFSATKPSGLRQAQEQLNKNFTQYSKYPKIIVPAAMEYFVIKSAYENADEKWYRSYPTMEDRLRLGNKVKINAYYTLCEQTKDVDVCGSLKKELDYVSKLSGYKGFKPKIIELPKIDVAAKTFTTVNGETYSFETGELVFKTNKPAQLAMSSASPGGSKQALATAVTGEKTSAGQQTEALTDEKNNTDDSDYSCEWSNTLPRKIVRGSGCQTSGTRICTGYVTCGTSSRKADRLATCSESLCGNGQATSCARQPGYGSKSADEDDSSFTNSKKSSSAGGVSQ